jgi:hypothetical protein
VDPGLRRDDELIVRGAVCLIYDSRHVGRLDAATKADFARFELTMKAEIAPVESQIELLRRDLSIRLGGMIVVMTGVPLAATLLG